MISNEKSLLYGRQPYFQPSYNSQPRPPVIDDTLRSVELQIERKIFILILKENPRGRFLRIIEDGGTSRRPVSIIVPATGLKDFQKILADMVKAETVIPPKKESPPA